MQILSFQNKTLYSANYVLVLLQKNNASTTIYHFHPLTTRFLHG